MRRASDHPHPHSGTRPPDVSHTSLGLICQSVSVLEMGNFPFVSWSLEQSYCHLLSMGRRTSRHWILIIMLPVLWLPFVHFLKFQILH